MKSFKKQRLRLWKIDPRCHWCGIETIWVDIEGGRMPENGATIDHLRSRLNPARTAGLEYPNERRRVIACFACNQRRDHEEHSAHIDIVRRKTGVYPIGTAVIRLADAIASALESGSRIEIRYTA